MKKIFLPLFLLIASSLFAMSDAELLKLAEDKTAFFNTDFKGAYTVVQEKPGEGRSSTEAIMYRRDSVEKWTILVTGPSAKDKGKGYLQTDGDIWFYDPADRRFTFTSAKDKFQGTNANNSDFAPQYYYSKYDMVSVSDDKLGKLDCRKFVLKAKANSKKVDYPELRIWVTKDDGLVRMKEDYSLSGQKLRTTLVPSYQNVEKSAGLVYSVPSMMVIRDELKGKKIGEKFQCEKTQITIKDISFKKQKDAVYTKPYLEMMSQK